MEERCSYTNKVDIWGMGCIFYELSFCKKAFLGDFAVLQYALSKAVLEIPSKLDLQVSISVGGMAYVGGALREIVMRSIYEMLEHTPSYRPTARQLFETFSANSAAGLEDMLRRCTILCSQGEAIPSNYI